MWTVLANFWCILISGCGHYNDAKSKTPELPEEAKTILGEAVAGGGRIMHAHFHGGEMPSANRKNLLSDSGFRTIAKWRGRLEDLVRRHFIKGIGHEGQIFEVTH